MCACLAPKKTAHPLLRTAAWWASADHVRSSKPNPKHLPPHPHPRRMCWKSPSGMSSFKGFQRRMAQTPDPQNESASLLMAYQSHQSGRSAIVQQDSISWNKVIVGGFPYKTTVYGLHVTWHHHSSLNKKEVAGTLNLSTIPRTGHFRRFTGAAGGLAPSFEIG